MCRNVLIIQDDVDCWRGNFVVQAHYCARMFAIQTNALTVPLSDLTQTCQIRCTCDMLRIALIVYTREITQFRMVSKRTMSIRSSLLPSLSPLPFCSCKEIWIFFSKTKTIDFKCFNSLRKILLFIYKNDTTQNVLLL